MDSKQAPPAYGDAVYDPQAGSYNQGYTPGAGDQGTAPQAMAPPQGYGAPPAGAGGYGGQPPPAGGYYQPPQQAGYPPAQGGGYAYHQAVVVNQPMTQGAVVNSVPDHMGLAIFTTLCCCWPLGLVAIMRASESRRALERGDYPAASTYSQESRRYSMWAIAGGCISIVAIIVIVVVYVTTAAASTSYYG